MSKELIERVAKAICAADHHAAWPGDGYNDRAQKRQYCKEAEAAIAEYEKAKQEAEDAEDERMYTEFHK